MIAQIAFHLLDAGIAVSEWIFSVKFYDPKNSK